MKVILGAGGKTQDGWVSTERHQLDLLKRDDFERMLSGEAGFEAMTAEHIFEHVPCDRIPEALKNCYDYLLQGGNLRIAVPDGLHPDQAYIDYVKPGGTGAGAGDHTVLFNYRMLARLLRNAGFRVEFLEWWDEMGVFHACLWNEADGYIERCLANDERNQDGKPHYTSLIVDAIKEDAQQTGLQKAFEFLEQNDINKVSPFNRKKTTVIYELAKSAPCNGVIVELGSYHGNGTAALWFGARDGHRNKVIAVDAYKSMKGWIGEPYEPEDMEIWYKNIEKAKIYPSLVQSDVQELSRRWKEPIALLVHDLGSKGRMPRDVLEWERHIVIGGIIAMRDIDDYSMGTDEAVKRLVATGRWGKRKTWDAFITSMERIE